MTFITSFQIFVLCCLSMQHCFCLLATVTTVGIATKVGTVSIVSTVSMTDTLFHSRDILNTNMYCLSL